LGLYGRRGYNRYRDIVRMSLAFRTGHPLLGDRKS
jgi:hypothetical protein